MSASLGLGLGFAQVQTYPVRPITLMVPSAAGGPTDTIARQAMAAKLAQTVLIENVTGAAGSIGVGRVARGNRDGYTLGIDH